MNNAVVVFETHALYSGWCRKPQKNNNVVIHYLPLCGKETTQAIRTDKKNYKERSDLEF